MGKQEIKKVKINFATPVDRAELLQYICKKQKLDLADVKKKADIATTGIISYEGITKALRILKINYSVDFSEGSLIATVPVIPAEGTKIIHNPENIENTSVDYTKETNGLLPNSTKIDNTNVEVKKEENKKIDEEDPFG